MLRSQENDEVDEVAMKRKVESRPRLAHARTAATFSGQNDLFPFFPPRPYQFLQIVYLDIAQPKHFAVASSEIR